MGNREIARGLFAAGLLVAGAILVMGWQLAPDQSSFTAMLGFGLLFLGFILGLTIFAIPRDQRSDTALDRLDDRFVD